MKAVGFGEPLEILSSSKSTVVKKVIMLRGISSASPSIITRLPHSVRDAIKCHREEIDQELEALEGAPSVSAAINEMRNSCSKDELIAALETAYSIVKNLLISPSDIRKFRVKRDNPTFHRCLGRLNGSSSLMRAIGFVGSDNDTDRGAFVLKSLGDGFDASAAATAGSANFKFPSLDPQTEKFLFRRKADLEQALRNLRLRTSDVDLRATNITIEEKTKAEGLHAGYKGKHLPKSTRRRGNSRIPVSSTHVHQTIFPDSLHDFLVNSSAARKAQIKMICEVFRRMDIDQGEPDLNVNILILKVDGFLSVNDMRQYFRGLGKDSSDSSIRNWVRVRDIDQDGVVSLSEFVAGFVNQLDPASCIDGEEIVVADVSPLTSAIGALRLGSSTAECLESIRWIEEYVQRILDSPSNASYWRIAKSDKTYHSKIGRLFGGDKVLMGELRYTQYRSDFFKTYVAFGFSYEENGSALVLRDPNGMFWATVPPDVRNTLKNLLEELRSHKYALEEPSISNIAAVSTAIVNLDPIGGGGRKWLVALETIVLIVSNVIKHPKSAKYYKLNTSNPTFHQKIGQVENAIGKLIYYEIFLPKTF